MKSVKTDELLGASLLGLFGIITSTSVMLLVFSKYPNAHPITYMLSVGAVSWVMTIAGFFVGKD